MADDILTLRDRFAIAALDALLRLQFADETPPSMDTSDEINFEEIAGTAYEIAEAMWRERAARAKVREEEGE